MDKYAPVVLFVYNRPEHTRRTVESLLNNTLINNSRLFIFSDGGKSKNDAKKVSEVRKTLRNIWGFSNIEIIEKEKNIGLAQSVITGVNQVLAFYEKVIVLEDDVITAPSFLTFMNKALEFYQSNENIFSVSGYPYSIEIPDSYKKDVFISYRTSSWGWGTWKDRWKKVDWELKDFDRFAKDKNIQKTFNRGGDDLTPMLKAQMWGKIDSWAVRWNYAHFKQNAFCLLPVYPFCKNIGTDKSGTHSSSSKKFDLELTDNKGDMIFFTDLNIDDEIIQRIRKLVKPSRVRKIINNLKDYIH